MAHPIAFQSDSLPEVAPNAPSEGLQVHWPNHDGLEVVQNQPYKPNPTPEYVPYTAPSQLAPSAEKKGIAGWSKRRKWIVASGVVLVIVAIVVGVTVGLLVGQDNSSDDDNRDSSSGGQSSESPPSSTTNTASETPTNTAFGIPTTFPTDVQASDSSCYNRICPSLVAAAQPEESSIVILGRGTDGEYYYREGDADRWLGDWESIGSGFISQPGAVSPNRGRVDVFGLQEENREMFYRSYRGGNWDPSWTNLTGQHFAPPTLCSWGDNAVSIYTLTTEQNVGYKHYHEGDWTPEGGEWWRANTGFLSSSPGVSCHRGWLDVLAYGEEQPYELIVKRGNSSDLTHGNWHNLGGDFRGDPVGASVEDVTAFLGIGSNNAMYFATLVDDREEVALDDDGFRNLGGSFQSVPSVLVDGDRIDVVAVGTDGRLKHKSRVDGSWGAQDWDDLGGFFSSAPVALRRGDTAVVFGVDTGGRIFHGVWDLDGDGSWGNGQWFVDGGDFSTEAFRVGSA